MNSKLTYRDISGLFDSGNFASQYYRQPNGVYRVQAHTEMPNVTPDMVRWWFADYLQTTDHYKRWHPKDHVWLAWDNKRPHHVIDAACLVHEYVGKELFKIRIQFIEPAEILDGVKPKAGQYIIAAKVGELNRPMNIATMCHIVNATETGSEMRSVFWMGHVSKRKGNADVKSLANHLLNTKFMRTLLIKDQFAKDLMIHCQEEMSILAGFLPALYTDETSK